MKQNPNATPTVSPSSSEIDKKINKLSTSEIDKLKKLGWRNSGLKNLLLTLTRIKMLMI